MIVILTCYVKDIWQLIVVTLSICAYAVKFLRRPFIALFVGTAARQVACSRTVTQSENDQFIYLQHGENQPVNLSISGALGK